MIATPPDVAGYERVPSLNGHRPQAGPGKQDRSLPRKVADFLTAAKVRDWVKRKVVTMLMNALIVGAAAATALTGGLLAQHHWPDQSTWGVGALKLFALWCLAFLPGWLYVRFLDLRAEALWNEYVLNLHRLGWDSPGLLPRPPRTSHFYGQWKDENKDPESEAGTGSESTDNIYQQKFEAYYGREVPLVAKRRAADRQHPDEKTKQQRDKQDGQKDRSYEVRTESLFPVFLSTAVFAVSWAAVLWNTDFIIGPPGRWDVLKFGFLGAYAFVTSMLIRRYFQSDLRPSAYASSVYRIILVLLVIVALHQVIGQISPVARHAEPAVAFMIGFFPLVGLQVLQRLTSRTLRRAVPPVTSEYPLDQLDGLNLWYEARLTEEGVEDMQNLTTMNLVDVILHTRVPTGRLVDWIDQAFLLTHLDRTDRRELNDRRQELAERARKSSELSQQCKQHAVNRGPVSLGAGLGAVDGADARLSLRRFGVRTATDLLKMFSVVDLSGGKPVRCFHRPPYLDRLPLPVEQLRILVTVLCAEPGLTPVWNWQANGVPVCQPAHNGSRCPA